MNTSPLGSAFSDSAHVSRTPSSTIHRFFHVSREKSVPLAPPSFVSHPCFTTLFTADRPAWPIDDTLEPEAAAMLPVLEPEAEATLPPPPPPPPPWSTRYCASDTFDCWRIRIACAAACT